MNKFLSRDILPSSFRTEGDVSIINELYNKNNFKSAVFYPSSGFDINDLFYVNSKRIEEIRDYDTNVYIHSDFLFAEDYVLTFDKIIGHPNFHFTKFKYFNNEK